MVVAKNANQHPSELVQKAFVLSFFIILLILMVFPLVIVGLNAFKSPMDYSLSGPMAFPSELYLDGIRNFWIRVDFTTKLWNSLSISLSVAIAGAFLSLLNGFALGIGKIRGRVFILVLFVLANTLPHESLAYPLYYIANFLGLYDTRISVIIIFTVIHSGFGTYLLSGVLRSFPKEAIEAAEIDGANRLRILFTIVAPMSKSSLALLFTFFFIWTWNEFFLPLILLVSNRNQTVPIAIAVAQGQHNMDVTMASASAFLGLIPCMIFFMVFQRSLSKGMHSGTIK
jgi:raffinose/stachyose/melibiose transport system permease protein